MKNKEYTLIDTYNDLEYQDYLENCEFNGIEPAIDGSEDFYNFCHRQKELDIEDFFNNLKYCKDLPSCWVVTGSLGLWYGRPEVNQIIYDDLEEVIRKCIDHCDMFIVVKKGNTIEVSGWHHDGRNDFEICGLSDLGKNRLHRNGKVSISNRENVFKLPEYLY